MRRCPVADLPAALSAAGYERCQQIEGAGQFAVRGGIVDVFPADSPAPVRMELWGDTVDTLSYFDLLTQRRTEPLDAIAIPPAAEIMYDDRRHWLLPLSSWPPPSAGAAPMQCAPICWPMWTACAAAHAPPAWTNTCR